MNAEDRTFHILLSCVLGATCIVLTTLNLNAQALPVIAADTLVLWRLILAEISGR